MSVPILNNEAVPDFYNDAGTAFFNMGPPPSFEFCEMHPEVRQYVRCADPANPADTIFKTSGGSQGVDDGLLLLAVLALIVFMA